MYTIGLLSLSRRSPLLVVVGRASSGDQQSRRVEVVEVQRDKSERDLE